MQPSSSVRMRSARYGSSSFTAIEGERSMAAHQLAAGPAPAMAPPPVEYAVAAEEYLARAPLGPASRRVYRISLTGWAWPLAGKPVPAGPERRRAEPPVLPLAMLDDAA